MMRYCRFFFFFQAEDGIRDKLVTGVQTCALPICVPFQGPHLPPCLYIPDLDGFIPTARSQPTTVRAKRNAANVAPMTRQGMDLAAGGDVPELYALVCTRGSEVAAVRAESYGVNVFFVTAQRLYFFSGGHFPNLDRLVVTPGSDPAPVRAEGDIDY